MTFGLLVEPEDDLYQHPAMVETHLQDVGAYAINMLVAAFVCYSVKNDLV